MDNTTPNSNGGTQKAGLLSHWSSSLQDSDSTTFQTIAVQIKREVSTMGIDLKGENLVLGGRRGLQFIDLETPTKLDVAKQLKDPKQVNKDITHVRWGAEQYLLGTSCGNELTLWDLGDKAGIISKSKCHTKPISSFDWCRYNKNLIASGSLDPDGYIYIWDIRLPTNPEKTAACKSLQGGMTNVKWNRVDENLIASLHGAQVICWDIRKTGNPVATIVSGLKPLHNFDWSHKDPEQIVTCGSTNNVSVWSFRQPKQPLHTLPSEISAVKAYFTPFGSGIATSTNQDGHNFDIYNLQDSSESKLVGSFYGEGQSAPISRFAWRKSFLGESYEYQCVSWSNKDQTLRFWPIDSHVQESCYHISSTLNKSLSKKTPKKVESQEQFNEMQWGGRDRTASLRSMSLEQELSGIVKNPPSGVSLLSMVISKEERYTLFSLQKDKVQVQIKITFPSLYPKMAPPSFILSGSSFKPDQLPVVKQIIVEDTEMYIASGRNCVLKCLEKLMSMLSNEEYFVQDGTEIAETAPKNIPPNHILYTVKLGESLVSISQKFGMAPRDFKKVNGIMHSMQVIPGKEVFVLSHPKDELRKLKPTLSVRNLIKSSRDDIAIASSPRPSKLWLLGDLNAKGRSVKLQSDRSDESARETGLMVVKCTYIVEGLEIPGALRLQGEQLVFEPEHESQIDDEHANIETKWINQVMPLTSDLNDFDAHTIQIILNEKAPVHNIYTFKGAKKQIDMLSDAINERIQAGNESSLGYLNLDTVPKSTKQDDMKKSPSRWGLDLPFRTKKSISDFNKFDKLKPTPSPEPTLSDSADEDTPELIGEGLITAQLFKQLRPYLPYRLRICNLRLVFCTSIHGTSLMTFYRMMVDKSPSIIVIKDTNRHVFGGFVNEDWTLDHRQYFGNGECFLFSLLPTFGVYKTTGADTCYMLAKHDYIAMGGGANSGVHGFWLDNELYYGSSGVSKTFLNRPLASSEDFMCATVEVWSLESF